MRKLIIVSLALAIGLGPEAIAQTRQDPAPTVLDDVVVDGRPLREAVDAFVDAVTEPPPGRGPARWRRICVGAVNLRRDAAQALIDRVSEIAGDIGLETGEPGCQPNILIIATDQAAALTDALIEARPHAFRPGYAGASQSQDALEAFRTSTHPVRWWHVSVPVVRGTGQIAVRLPAGDPPIVPAGNRLTSNITNALLRTFVIVDVSRMEGITFQQLGDYVAMVSFAQIDPAADTSSFSSVLNLFSDQPDQSLTSWDYAYLRALYEAELNRRNPEAQLGELGTIMIRDHRAAQLD